MRALVLLLAAAACCTHAFGGGDRFTEELDLQVLPDGHVYAGFRFGMHAPARSADFRVLPKPLMQILHHFSVEELHLSLTRGRWNYPQWGAAGLQPHPFGLLLAVNFYKHDHRREGWPHNGTLHGDVEEQWKGLVHALAGLFCASVNFLDVREHRDEKIRNFEDSLQYAKGIVASPHMVAVNLSRPPDRLGVLSNEALCTENLTPFALLLPSRGKSGLGALANPLKVFNSAYHSLSLRYEFDEANARESLRQMVDVVLHTASRRGIKRNHASWTLARLFGAAGGATACPLAQSSEIRLTVVPGLFGAPASPEAWPFRITPSPDRVVPLPTETTLHFALHPTNPTNVSLKWKAATPIAGYNALSRFPLTLHRYQTGTGSLSGTIVTSLNNSWDVPLAVTYLELIPFSLLPYFHTLSLVATSAAPGAPPEERPLRPDRMVVTPAPLPTSASSFELQFAIPPRSCVLLSWAFDKQSLKLAWYPPDAHRGFELPSPLISLQVPWGRDA